MTDHKVGNAWRQAGYDWNNANFQLGDIGAARSTQVWLMGDGTNDSFPDVFDQTCNTLNRQCLVAHQMTSADVVNVTIPGLS